MKAKFLFFSGEKFEINSTLKHNIQENINRCIK